MIVGHQAPLLGPVQEVTTQLRRFHFSFFIFDFIFVQIKIWTNRSYAMPGSLSMEGKLIQVSLSMYSKRRSGNSPPLLLHWIYISIH